MYGTHHSWQYVYLVCYVEVGTGCILQDSSSSVHSTGLGRCKILLRRLFRQAHRAGPLHLATDIHSFRHRRNHSLHRHNLFMNDRRYSSSTLTSLPRTQLPDRSQLRLRRKLVSLNRPAARHRSRGPDTAIKASCE